MKKIIISIFIIGISLMVILLFINNSDNRKEIIENDDTKEIIYGLIDDYFNSYYSSDTPKDLRLKKHTIKEIHIISKDDSNIKASFKAKIVPKSLNYGWATTDIDYYLTIEKTNNEWKIVNQSTGT